MSDDDFENTDAPEINSYTPIIVNSPHSEDCPLSDKTNWRLMHGLTIPKPGIACTCVKSVPVPDRDIPATGTHHPVDIHDVPGSVTTRPVWVEPKEVDQMPIYDEEDGEADENEPEEGEVPEPDKKPSITADSGWMSPHDSAYPLLDIPEVTARRGGMSFTFPGDPYKGLGKKELRARLKERDKRIREYGDILAKERKRTRKLVRKVHRLLDIVERLAGK